MEDLQEAYLAIYEESDIAARTKRAVGHQRGGTHGDDHAMERESEESTKSVNKVTKYKGAKVTPSMAEDVDLYDVVLDYLLDEGYADTEDNAITIMANMSEEWIDTILDEAQIMSVSGKGGLKYMINPKILRAQNAAAKEAQGRKAREKAAKEAQNAERLNAANKRGIDRATNRSDRTDFISGSALRAHERDEPSTDYRARRRRASGR